MFNAGGFEDRPQWRIRERSLFEVVAVVAGEDESAVDPSRVTVERLDTFPRNGTRRR
jgi:hypothetical protein